MFIIEHKSDKYQESASPEDVLFWVRALGFSKIQNMTREEAHKKVDEVHDEVIRVSRELVSGKVVDLGWGLAHPTIKES